MPQLCLQGWLAGQLLLKDEALSYRGWGQGRNEACACLIDSQKIQKQPKCHVQYR
jgi:hypothetical protein